MKKPKQSKSNQTKQWVAVAVESLPDGIHVWGPFDKEDVAQEFAALLGEAIQMKPHGRVLCWDALPFGDPFTFRDPDPAGKRYRWMPDNQPGERFGDPAAWGPEGKKKQ